MEGNMYCALTVVGYCAKTFTLTISQTTYRGHPIVTCFPDVESEGFEEIWPRSNCGEVRSCTELCTQRSGTGMASPYPPPAWSVICPGGQANMWKGFTDKSFPFPPSVFTIIMEHWLSLFQDSFVTCGNPQMCVSSCGENHSCNIPIIAWTALGIEVQKQQNEWTVEHTPLNYSARSLKWVSTHPDIYSW